MKKALITGITGQDGSYLAEFLLEKGYDVHGVIRRSSVDYRERIAHLEGHPHFHLHYGDLSDSMSILFFFSAAAPADLCARCLRGALPISPMRPPGHSPPISCGIAPSPPGGSMAWRTAVNGLRLAHPPISRRPKPD